MKSIARIGSRLLLCTVATLVLLASTAMASPDAHSYAHHQGIEQDQYHLFTNAGSGLTADALKGVFVPASFALDLARGRHTGSDDGKFLVDSGLNKSPAGKSGHSCPDWDPKNYTRQPIKLREWWEKLKAKDMAEGGLVRGGIPWKPRHDLCKDEPGTQHENSRNQHHFQHFQHTGNTRPISRYLRPYVPPPPRFNAYACCVYTDQNITKGLPDPRDLIDMNVLTLAFVTRNSTVGKASYFFNNMTSHERRLIVERYHAAGISLWLSTFGGSEDEVPIGDNYDPRALGELHGEIAYTSGFDGVDNDFEDFPAMDRQDYTAVQWIAEYTRGLRKWLPASDGFGLSAAPVAPWFSSSRQKLCHGAWQTIDQRVGHLYDFYNVQFYNQGVGSYDSCQTILFHSNVTQFPQSSIFEIHSNGIALDKLVIGKPGWPVDANNGYVAPEILANCSSWAKSQGWKAGFSSWQFPHASTQWWREVRMSSFPSS